MADETAPQRPDTRELAVTTGGRDITRGFATGIQLPQDPTLRAKGGNYEVYEWVAGDDQVKATFQQRRLAVTSHEWEVVPGGTAAIDKQAAESLKEQLDALSWDSVTEKMLNGVFYGYAVGECLWAIDGAQVVLSKVKVRKQRRFVFDVDGALRLLTVQQPQGEIMPARKFWTFATGADNDDEPYGLGLAHWLYWPVFFKRNGIKFWLTFLEKLGMPTVHGQHPPEASEPEKKKLLAALAALQQDSAIITPEGVTVGLIEAAKSATPDYATLLDKMNAAISKVIVGQTMTTDDGSSKSQAAVHLDVRQDLVKADSDLVSESFNLGPARWLTEWNYPGAKPPKVWRRVEESPDPKAVAERDQLVASMGFKPTLAYIRATYGEGWDAKGAGDGAAPIGADAAGGATFAEPAAAADQVDALAARAEAAAQPAVDTIIDRIRQEVDAAASLEELRDRLLQLYPQLKVDQLADQIREALVLADLVGQDDGRSG